MNRLEESQENIYSQNGEDGILAEIFRRFGIEKGFFVEFGAWDGIKYSNTYSLLENNGWVGAYIEGERDRFEDLKKNVPQPEIIKICEFVATAGEKSLDRILAAHEIPEQFDLLSIDIDSDDFAVWDGLQNYRPSVVVIEFNPTIPLDTEYVQPLGATIGNSALAQFNLGRKKDYVAVAMTAWNLIFVRREMFSRLGMEPQSLDELAAPHTLSRIFYGYDGSLVHCGPERFFGNPWQKRANFQVPKPFRYFDDRSVFADLAKRLTVNVLKRICR